MELQLTKEQIWPVMPTPEVIAYLNERPTEGRDRFGLYFWHCLGNRGKVLVFCKQYRPEKRSLPLF